uniref:Pyroglutamylated RFamide peptide n=1 Tax=Nannospalax galili TaxID=1026970 RepID=A0A8C6R7Y9_NANGA
MRRLQALPFLLLFFFLPLGTCFPLLARRGSSDAAGVIGTSMSWAHLAEGRRPHSGRSPQPQALLMVAKELQASHKEHTGFRPGRQDVSGEAAGFLPADLKTSGPLGSLAEELNSYSRRKGGFSFRFGR